MVRQPTAAETLAEPSAPAETRPTLYLIDGYALIYRAYFALLKNPLRTMSGEDTSAPYGMATFLLKLLDDYKPDYLGLVLDSARRTYRHEVYPEYKATRQKMPDELQGQIGRVRQLFEAFRVPIIEKDGWEADDVMGTLARRAAGQGFDVVLVTADKDFWQLIDEHVRILNPGRGGMAAVDEEVIDLANAARKFGVPPERVADVLALIGDTSDNIPGVPGIGPKTAVKLVQEFGSVESIYASLEVVGTPKLRQTLDAHRTQALLSKHLVTIPTELDIECDLEALRLQDPDTRAVVDLFRELEFNRYLDRFTTRSAPVAAAAYRIVPGLEDLAELVQVLRQREVVGFALVTTGATPTRANVVGLALAGGAAEAAYVPICHSEGPCLERAAVMAVLRPLLADSHVEKVSGDWKRDLLVWEREGVAVAGPLLDVGLASYVLNPGRRSHSIEALALEFMEHRTLRHEDLVMSGRRRIPFEDVPQEPARDYACEEADLGLRLRERLAADLQGRDLDRLFRELEMPLVRVLVEMERHGVALDLPFFFAQSHAMAAELERLTLEIHREAGEEFNVASTRQLQAILFDKLGLPVRKRTKTGPSTDVSVLEKLAAEGFAVPRLMIEQRELAKLQGTYVDAFPQLLNPETGRLHTSFNQTVATTGRLSSSNPNLQNIPIRTEIGRELRKGFVAPPGSVLVSADYSQIELRLVAHLSKDENMLEAFRTDVDIHRRTAALVLGLPEGQVTSQHRNMAKMVNFGLIYGMSAFGLSDRLGIEQEEAAAFIRDYFAAFPGVRGYQDDAVATAQELGYVSTLLGRRRYLPEIRSRNFAIREFAKRTAINSPIQGTAADLIKLAMIRIGRLLRGEETADGHPVSGGAGQNGGRTAAAFRSRMILQVHDELVFDVPEDELDVLIPAVKERMENAIRLDVPVVVDVGVGRNWYEAKG
ncbi:MAG: DNA polymerase I [Gemmatimonadetes bacterium]|nr:DNA polymerase I [Gemmatimonadota bacterium]